MHNLHTFSTEQLLEEIKKREEATRQNQHISNLQPIGYWEVTTEGDCEGKTIRKLGIFQGHIVDIAFSLAHEACYGLRFSPVVPKTAMSSNQRKSVNISLGIDSGTWDMTHELRRAHFIKMLSKSVPKFFSHNSFIIGDGEYHACVKLTTIQS